MLNIEALNIVDEAPQATGTVIFNNLNATPYYMADNEGVNAGISFAYEGGKFSCPIEPEIAKQLDQAAKRHKVSFSKVEMEVIPASFGREKKAGIRAVKVTGLWCGSTKVYPAAEGTKK